MKTFRFIRRNSLHLREYFDLDESVRKLATLLALSATAAFAADVAYTPPVGGMTITLAAPVNGVAKVTTFSVPLRLSVSPSFVGSAFGTVTAISGGVVTDANASWSAGALSQSSIPYFIQFTSGALSGTWWQISTSGSAQNTPTSITLLNRAGTNAQALGATVGDKFRIVPADTLGTLFAGLESQIGGANSSANDSVRIFNGLTWQTFNYNTTNHHWQQGNINISQDNVVVAPDSGVIFTRNLPGSVSLVQLGEVSMMNEAYVIPGNGVAFLGGVYPVARTLGGAGLNTYSGFVPNSGTVATADQFNVYNGNTWTLFNYSQVRNQWQQGNINITQNNVALAVATPVILTRGSGSSGTPSVLTLTKPY